mmetsp:Transcript_10912/g.14445  ORF Transcript_10912/g.14445 Transcript_10912/m.14445 type:complete len:124 (-) Transcript_10912:210-581(-)|eukprot:CAMPEP_0198143844 /NCGR_PEP_ID=MMETSP1443-20131203/10829_1 /TAXON_ID=186043 /ORGANISM="Entomoneis sp., Strain CCMP2396" /LENGTH=123 /DNA_ID=CAMNT_0043807133 /DNA_START=72 /DNA_END=443 /DNA_ORIENTATION=+
MSSNRASSLYRSLFRAHKKYLPGEMRALGDTYIKAEFKLHKKAAPEQTSVFFVEWDKYLAQLVQQGEQARNQESLSAVGNLDQDQERTVREFGQDLPSDLELTEEQTTQLDKLRAEASTIPEK